MEKKLEDKKIGAWVADDYRFADVFEKYGIDFCCGGGVSLEEACRRKGLDTGEIVTELLARKESVSKIGDFNSWPLDELVAHIVNVHHTYVKASLPPLREYSAKVANVHGAEHPETIKINALIEELAQELTAHLKKEEVVLFPYILQLVAGKENEGQIPPPFGSVGNPITVMEQEHDLAGEIMKEIRELSTGFTPPEDACTTYEVLYRKLNEFNLDLHQHIHLENNILFPKAIEMEKAANS